MPTDPQLSPSTVAAPQQARASAWRRPLQSIAAALWRMAGGAGRPGEVEGDAPAALIALQRSEQQLRLAEQLANLGSFDWDPVSGDLHWSDQHFAIWGLPPRSVTPDYALFRGGVHPQDLAALEALLQQALAGGRRYQCEHRVVWPDGTVRHILAHGEVSFDAQGVGRRMVGTVQDITLRHAAEVQMRRDAFIVNAITDPISVIDGDRVYHMVNDAWVQDTGVSREAIVGTPPGDFQRLVRSEERDRALDLCTQQGLRQTARRHIQIAGKADRWMETTMFPYDDPTSVGKAAVLVTRDVTEQYRGRQALADSVDNLRLTLNATQDGIFASDALAGGDPLLFVNRRLLEIWHIAPARAAGLTPAGVITAARRFFVDPEREMARIAEVIGSSEPQEDRLVLKDGRVLLRRCEPTQSAGRQVRVWSFRDITLEDRALQALRDSDARQRALLDAFPGYLLRVNHELRYTYVNRRLDALSGRLPDDLIGRSVAEVAPNDEEAAISVQRSQQALAGETVTYERHYAGPGGGPGQQVMMTLAPGTDPATGKPLFFGFGIDITELKNTEAALIHARDEAEQASRAKSAFLSSMSHELRTPMNAVLGFAQVLAADPTMGARQRHQLGQILLGGRQLLELINDLLDLSRIEAGQLPVQLQAVALPTLVDDCLALVAGHARQRNVHLAPMPDAPRLAVRADGRRLQQVLLNLLDNAIKYNRDGGWVRVDWQPIGGRVRCTVRDSGPGIDSSMLGRLFQLFERLDADLSAVEGTGIGLALCRRLITLMGGEIGVDSQPGSGSSFWFTLDADDLAAATPAEPGGPAEPAVIDTGQGTHGRHLVLCIEDNPVNLIVLETMLESMQGIDLHCATEPQAGLAMALADPPDLVLLDIQMPGMDGYEVLRRLRADPATRQVPVIAASANAMPQDMARGLAAGFADYLTKPLDLPRLQAAVRAALADTPARG